LTVLALRRLRLSVLLLRRLAVLTLRLPILLRRCPMLRLPVLSLLLRRLAISSRSGSSRLVSSLLVHPLRRLSVRLLRLAVSLRRRRSAVPDVHVRISFIGERCQWVFVVTECSGRKRSRWVLVMVVRTNSR
jgi:hypothetical protein